MSFAADIRDTHQSVDAGVRAAQRSGPKITWWRWFGTCKSGNPEDGEGDSRFGRYGRSGIYINIWCSVGHPPLPPPPPMGMGGQYRLVLLVPPPPPVACGGGMVLLVPPPPPVACGGGMVPLVPPPPLWPVVVVWFFWSPPLWPVVVVCWYVGMLVCWYVGMYVCMYVCNVM